MSKSMGNTISPMDVAAKRGAELLRLWVSMVDFLEDMRLSDEIMDRNAEAYRKIRNTFRYLLGNLDGFDPRDRVEAAGMRGFDAGPLKNSVAVEALTPVLIGLNIRHKVKATGIKITGI